MAKTGDSLRKRHNNIGEKNIFSKKNIKKVEKRLALANIFVSLHSVGKVPADST